MSIKLHHLLIVTWLLGVTQFGQAQTAFDCTAVTTIPTAECTALVTLYNQTNGDGWTDNTNWLSGSPCDWYGIDCAGGNRVSRLFLDQNNLDGTIPAELGDLTELTWLQLDGNMLRGEIPAELGSLTQVTWLRLENNQLEGAIPAELGNMAALQSFYLSGNNVSGAIPPQLGNLSNLQKLYLSDTALSGSVPAELGNLTQLEALTLGGTELTGALPLSFTNLSVMTYFHFLGTTLCEPADATFQTWRNTIGNIYSPELSCDENQPVSTPLPTTPPIDTPVTTYTPEPTDVVVEPTYTPEPVAPTPVSTGGTNYCEGVAIQDNRSVAIPQMEKPQPMQPYTDPAFGMEVMRMSDAVDGGVIKTAYNTIQAWNTDESYLILYHTGAETAGHYLYDGRTYQLIRQLQFVPRDLEQFFWDDTDPNILYFINRVSPNYGDLIRFDVRDDSHTVLTNFDEVCGQDSAPQGGNDVQMMSWDGDKIGLRCGNATSADPVDTTFYYTISTDTVSNLLQIGENSPYSPWNAAQMAPSGNRLSLNATVLDANMNVERQLDYTGGEHSSLGLTHDGHDGLFTVAFSPAPSGCNGDPYSGIGALIAYDLETGSCRPIIGEGNGYNYPLSSTHPSALSRDAAGWVVISSIGYPDQLDTYFTNDEPAPVLLSEIYLANTDPDDQVVCRLAHHRSTGKLAQNGGYNSYFGEPHPIISPSGTRILFTSDWYDSGSVDTYVIELASYTDESAETDPVPLGVGEQVVIQNNQHNRLMMIAVIAGVVLCGVTMVRLMTKRGSVQK